MSSCGQCATFGCYGCNICPLPARDYCPWETPNPYGEPPIARIDPRISGYDEELDDLSSGSAKFNSHWRPCLNLNGFTPSGYM